MIAHHLHIQRLVMVVLAGIAVVLIGFVASVGLGARQSASANPLAGVAAVAAGENNSCFLLTDATVKCAGDNFGPVPAVVPGLSEPVGAITAGTSHMCALTQAGGVKCWGGSYGASPVDVAGETSNVAAIGAGSNYTCALDTGGGVSCWGGGNLAQLAPGLLSSGVTSLGIGYEHSCALLSGGTAKCWGKNDNGQLGDGTTVDSSSPVTVQGLPNATLVVAGINHSCALTAAGGVVCWGHTYGNAPGAVSGLTSGVTAISSSYLHTCALLTGGAVKCWGDNVFGELGDGLACGIQCAQPTNPDGLTAGVAQVSAGDYHTCVALVAGGAKCWGINFGGQLGAGMLTNSTRPLDVVLAMVKSPPTPTPCPMAGCPTQRRLLPARHLPASTGRCPLMSITTAGQTAARKAPTATRVRCPQAVRSASSLASTRFRRNYPATSASMRGPPTSSPSRSISLCWGTVCAICCGPATRCPNLPGVSTALPMPNASPASATGTGTFEQMC